MPDTDLGQDPVSYGDAVHPVRQDPWEYIVAVHWGDDSFVMATWGAGVVPSSIMISDDPGPVDAATWDTAAIPGSTGTLYPNGFGPKGLAFAGALWMIGGLGGFDGGTGQFFKKVFSSPDLANWTEVLSLPADSDEITGLAGGTVATNGKLTFVLAIGGLYDGSGRASRGAGSRLMTSVNNGETWTTTLTGDMQVFFVAVNFCKDAFFACAGDNSGSFGIDPTAGGSIWRSVDGVTWTQVSALPGSLIRSDGGPSSAFVLGVAYDDISDTYAAVGTHPLQGIHIDPHRVFPDLYAIDEIMFGASVNGVSWTWTAFVGYGPPLLSSTPIAGGGGFFVTSGQRYATTRDEAPDTPGFVTPYFAVAFAAPAAGSWTATDLDLPAVVPPIAGGAGSFAGSVVYGGGGDTQLFVLGAVGSIPGGTPGHESQGPRRKFFSSEDGAAWDETFTSDDVSSPGPSVSFGSFVTCAAVGSGAISSPPTPPGGVGEPGGDGGSSIGGSAEMAFGLNVVTGSGSSQGFGRANPSGDGFVVQSSDGYAGNFSSFATFPNNGNWTINLSGEIHVEGPSPALSAPVTFAVAIMDFDTLQVYAQTPSITVYPGDDQATTTSISGPVPPGAPRTIKATMGFSLFSGGDQISDIVFDGTRATITHTP